jgi:hypothetical protein
MQNALLPLSLSIEAVSAIVAYPHMKLKFICFTLKSIVCHGL